MERCTLRGRQRRFPRHLLMSSSIVLLLLLLAIQSAFPQLPSTKRYWITFRDKGTSAQVQTGSDAAQRLSISERALWRRGKVLPAGKLTDELDLPVDPAYIEQVRSTGATIRSTSRWFNAISAVMSVEQLRIVRTLAPVSAIEPVVIFLKKQPERESLPEASSLHKKTEKIVFEYGPSFTQLNGIKVVDVHKRGINGTGVIIGMIDDGFSNHAVHPSLKNIKLLAEYDFIQRDTNTSRAPGEYAGQGNHGAGTLSVVGGFEDGKLIGAAYGASFILAKTEIDSVEIKVEEDLYVEALEWMERQGADIVSTSLGYIDWYVYGNLDGRTATTTKAARIAARKGVLLVTAMGNEGSNKLGSLIAPADADSIVSVGATVAGGTLASFSSTGPTADGRVKPEVVAQGVNVYAMYGESGYRYVNGTSFSTPLAAGVAALILSSDLTLTPMQIRERMIRTAVPVLSDSLRGRTVPNNYYGYGLLDATAATDEHRVNIPERFALLTNYPNPFNAGTVIIVDAPASQDVELAIYDLLGRKVRSLFTGRMIPGENRFFWNASADDAGSRLATGVYLCRLTTSTSILSVKMLYIK